MIHKHLEITRKNLGPHINFIAGKNGSTLHDAFAVQPPPRPERASVLFRRWKERHMHWNPDGSRQQSQWSAPSTGIATLPSACARALLWKAERGFGLPSDPTERANKLSDLVRNAPGVTSGSTEITLRDPPYAHCPR